MRVLGAPQGAISARAPGKINLILRVGPLREDGFHELLTCFQAVEMWETITVWPAATDTVSIAGDAVAGEVPLDASNIAVRAARAIGDKIGRDDGVHVHIDKKVPVGGGMAGGSADAAATLLAINELWGAGLTREELSEIAASLGSDVPFLLEGGTAIAYGRGEILEPVRSLPLHWVIVPSASHLSTPEGYRLLDIQREGFDVSLPEDVLATFLNALYHGDPVALTPHLRNDMTPAAIALVPEVASTLELGIHVGALAAMVSGSGPTCAFLAQDRDHAHALATRTRERGRHARVVSSPARGAHLVS